MACSRSFFILALALLCLAAGLLRAADSVGYQINSAHTGGQDGGTVPPNFAYAWSVDFQGGVECPLIAEGKAFLSVDGSTASSNPGYGSRLYALDLQTGAVVWGPTVLAGTYFANYVAYDRGLIFAVNFDGLVRAIDARTGVVKWQLPLDSFASAITADHGMVYVCGASRLYAIVGYSGQVVWSAIMSGGMNVAAPTVTSNAVYVAPSSGTVARLTASTGNVVWYYTPGSYSHPVSTIPYYQGRIYSGPNSGNYLLQSNPPKNLGILPAATYTPALGGNQLFVIFGANLTAYDLLGQNVHWTKAAPDGTSFSLPPIYVNGYVVAAVLGGQIFTEAGTAYFLDAATGKEIWNTPLPVGAYLGYGGNFPGMAAGEGHILIPSTTKLTAYTYPEGPLAPNYQILAKVGDPVSSVDESPLGVPAGAIWSAFGPPALNDAGDAAFLGTWNASGIQGRGIFAANVPAVVEKAQTNLGDGSVFSALTDPLFDDQGGVAFLATLDRAPFRGARSKSQSLWSKAPAATPSLIARSGVAAAASAEPPVPGAPVGINEGAVFSKVLSAAFDSTATGDSTLAFLATLKARAGGVKPTSNQGLWMATNGTVQLLVRTGSSVFFDNHSHTVRSIGALMPGAGVGGQGHGNAKGKVAVLLKCAEHTQAIGSYQVPDGAFSPIVSTVNGTFTNLGLPSQSADGTAVAFQGTTLAGVVKTPGVFASVAGNLQTIALKGQTIGTADRLLSLGAPIINNSGDLVFSATLPGATTGARPIHALVWVNQGTKTILAREGAVPPGCDAGATYGQFVSVALPEGGEMGPVFTAKLTLVAGTPSNLSLFTTTKNMGLWAVDSTGAVGLLLRTGQFAPGKLTGKTIQTLTVLPTVAGSYTQTRSVNSHRTIAVAITYNDRTSEIATVTVPLSFKN